MNVARLLEGMPNEVHGVSPSTPVFEAIGQMEDAGIGSLLVLDAKGRIAGIVSERDCLRRCVLKGKDPHRMTVRAIMSRPVRTVTPAIKIEKCMDLMARHHIRHLPVVRRGVPLAVISIKDIIRFLVSEKDFIIRNYEKYIAGV